MRPECQRATHKQENLHFELFGRRRRSRREQRLQREPKRRALGIKSKRARPRNRLARARIRAFVAFVDASGEWPVADAACRRLPDCCRRRANERFEEKKRAFEHRDEATSGAELVARRRFGERMSDAGGRLVSLASARSRRTRRRDEVHRAAGRRNVGAVDNRRRRRGRSSGRVEFRLRRRRRELAKHRGRKPLGE